MPQGAELTTTPQGAEIKGGAQDALIVIPPGGIVSIKTGHKEVAVPAENIPRTGLMDILITHKAVSYKRITHKAVRSNSNGFKLYYIFNTFLKQAQKSILFYF